MIDEGLWGGASAAVRRLVRGEILFHRGDPVRLMHRVVAGEVRLERSTIDGRRILLHRASAGALLAEASLFSETYHCDAVAAGDSVVESMPRDLFVSALREQPDRALRLARTLAEQLQGVRTRLELRNVRSAVDRLSLYLALIADPATGTVRLDRPIQELAAEIGLTREACYRAMARLQAQGSIVREGSAIRLTNRM